MKSYVSGTQLEMCALTAQILRSVPKIWTAPELPRVAVVNDVPAHRTIVMQVMLADNILLDPEMVKQWVQSEPVQWAQGHSVRPLEFVYEGNVISFTKCCILLAYFPGPLHTYWQLRWSDTVHQTRLLW
jgi:hypothetical protein